MKIKTISVLRITCAMILAVAAAGCVTSLGSRALPVARFNYNEAISRSWNEQMLLNLVRLRYRDTPQFLEISSVVTQFALDGRVSGSTNVKLDGGVDDLGLSGSVGYSERPTVTYKPLQGEEFAQRVLTPVTPATIVLLSQSGWSIERLMLCCVQQLNDVSNSPSAAGPTPRRAPRYERFHEAAQLLRRLQVAGMIQATTRRDDSGISLVLLLREEGELRAAGARLREVLDLPARGEEFEITTSVLDRDPQQVALVGRSLMSTLFFLSQAVDPPPAHQEQGKVTLTETQDGAPFDWAQVVGPLLWIPSRIDEPRDAYVKVHYRGYWFYIDDSDLNSKTTFGLLKYLFSLRSSAAGASPLLTISTGG